MDQSGCAGILSEYFTQLDDWEWDLLRDFEELPSETPLYLLLSTKAKLHLVSDGGNKANYGSFGWVIGNDTETIMYGKGYARGSPMQSFWAEAYGRLAMHRFLLHYIGFFQI